MNAYVLRFLKEFDYTDEDIAFVEQTFSALEAAGEMPALLSIVDRYRADKLADYTAMRSDVKALAERAGVDVFAVNFVWLLLMVEPCQAHAAAEGFPEEIFRENMKDLRYKYVECCLVQQKKGTFVPEWFYGFFQLTRVSFGCLQFELTSAKVPYEKDGVCVKEGDTVINVHIPRTGRHLPHEEALAAYQKAADFYPEAKHGAKTVFVCHSWLLFPYNLEILHPASNLSAFIRDYDVVRVDNYGHYGEFWRLFDCLYHGDPDALPADTSFRRGYIALAKSGKPMGEGLGYFLF